MTIDDELLELALQAKSNIVEPDSTTVVVRYNRLILYGKVEADGFRKR